MPRPLAPLLLRAESDSAGAKAASLLPRQAGPSLLSLLGAGRAVVADSSMPVERGATPSPRLGHTVDLVPLEPASLAVSVEANSGALLPTGQVPIFARQSHSHHGAREAHAEEIRSCYRNGQHEEQVGHSPHCPPAQHPAVRGKDRRGRRGRGCHKMLPLTPKPHRREPGEGDENEITPEKDSLTVRDEGRDY